MQSRARSLRRLLRTGRENVRAIIARMSEPIIPPSTDKKDPDRQQPARPISPIQVAAAASEKMICERCGAAEMNRMNAVWRCPACGFKTDCCGW